MLRLHYYPCVIYSVKYLIFLDIFQYLSSGLKTFEYRVNILLALREILVIFAHQRICACVGRLHVVTAMTLWAANSDCVAILRAQFVTTWLQGHRAAYGAKTLLEFQAKRRVAATRTT